MKRIWVLLCNCPQKSCKTQRRILTILQRMKTIETLDICPTTIGWNCKDTVIYKGFIWEGVTLQLYIKTLLVYHCNLLFFFGYKIRHDCSIYIMLMQVSLIPELQFSILFNLALYVVWVSLITHLILINAIALDYYQLKNAKFITLLQ